MIIPVRCMTCGKVLADKWKYFTEKTREMGGDKENEFISIKNPEQIQKTVKGKVMDELGLKRYCCRRHFISHVDLIDII
jgi:DNA-directed RNA polymerase subunit N (RpoN/RPB10)